LCTLNYTSTFFLSVLLCHLILGGGYRVGIWKILHIQLGVFLKFISKLWEKCMHHNFSYCFQTTL